MSSHTYTVGGVLTIESEFDIFLFDTELDGPVPEPDITIREGAGTDPAAERTETGLGLVVPSSFATERTDAVGPAPFMKLLFTAIQGTLLERGATLCFGGVFRTPDGDSVALFGPSGCGKSTAILTLARQRGDRVLGDDLFVCSAGEVRPFPRYMNLPRDVPVVRRWLRSGDVPDDQLVEWPDEVGVPRRLVSGTAPTELDLDYALLVQPDCPGGGETRIPTARLVAALSRLNDRTLTGWTSQPTVRAVFDSWADPEPLVRQAVDDAACYRLDTTSGTLVESILRVLEGGECRLPCSLIPGRSEKLEDREADESQRHNRQHGRDKRPNPVQREPTAVPDTHKRTGVRRGHQRQRQPQNGQCRVQPRHGRPEKADDVHAEKDDPDDADEKQVTQRPGFQVRNNLDADVCHTEDESERPSQHDHRDGPPQWRVVRWLSGKRDVEKRLFVDGEGERYQPETEFDHTDRDVVDHEQPDNGKQENRDNQRPEP